MDSTNALLLGIIQGFTEFLPVSSSGHLELAKYMLGDHSLPKESLEFTVVLHFATALSTIIVFRKDIYQILNKMVRLEKHEDVFLVAKIIISMVPAAIIGICLESQLAQLFARQPVLVGIMLVVTAVLLWTANRAAPTQKPIGYFHALVIGIAQAIAILPGISRSGATIATSVLLGNDKLKAARFSFLMVIPLIFGKIAKDLLDGSLEFRPGDIQAISIGFLAAFLSGLFACNWMISLVKKSKLTYFALYCLLVGISAVVYGLLIPGI